MNWKISFYNTKVEHETLKLPPSILANFLRIIDLIEEFGPDLGRPHTAPLSKGLFEIRAKGSEGIARSVFCTIHDRQIIILMTVIKKGRKIPKHQMETAQRRMKEIEQDD